MCGEDFRKWRRPRGESLSGRGAGSIWNVQLGWRAGSIWNCAGTEGVSCGLVGNGVT